MSLACRHCYSPRGGNDTALAAAHGSGSSSSSSSSSYASSDDEGENYDDDGLFDFLDAAGKDSSPQNPAAATSGEGDEIEEDSDEVEEESPLHERIDAMHISSDPARSTTPCSTVAPESKNPLCLDDAATYLGMFLYGRQDNLAKNMDMIERQRPIPGVTVWCDRCERVSIISHTFFTHLRNEVDNRRGNSSSKDRNEYYTRMCMQAEQLLRCQLSCITPGHDAAA